ncbi:MAG: TonB-dependent siderophore receptor [Azoarcus sp.]|jgi:outer membrane receptor for ferric coprogen and ferric-rhodotorulic acid|nr:TonB-dependent siderophore receptor [Azoarcus sp.]
MQASIFSHAALPARRAVDGLVDAHPGARPPPKRQITAILAAFLGIFCSGIAQAQDTASQPASSSAPADETLLPEVTVQATEEPGLTENSGAYTTPQVDAATRLPLSIRETPQSVTVITRQRIDDQGLDTLGEVLTQTPGISTNNSSGAEVGGYRPFYSRGYMLNNYQLDGALASSSAFGSSSGWQGNGSLDTALYDSIVVVRGATGLLTGAGDPAGSINLVRKRPTRQLQASVEQGLGRWNKSRSVADVGSPLNEAGTLRGRFVAAYEEGNSWQDHYKGYKRLAYGVLEADLGPATEVSLSLEHSDQNANGGGAYTGFEVGFTDGTKTPFSRSDNAMADWSTFSARRTSASLALTHRFSEDWRARLNYTHGRMEHSSKFAYAGVVQATPDGMGDLMLRKFKDEYQTDALDASLEGRFTLWGRQHDVAAGVNGSSSILDSPLLINTWAADKVQTLTWDGHVPEPDWSAYTSSPPRKTTTRQHGAFAVLRLRPAEPLSVILGGRLSTWEIRAKNRSTGAITDDRKETNVFTPYAGIVYDFNQQLSAYASYTSIFKPQNYKDVDGGILDPEDGENYELGLKAEWFNGRLQSNAAFFEVKKDNLAVADGARLTPEGNQAYVAANGTKGRGWEVELTGELARGWRAQGSYARIVTRGEDGDRLNTGTVPKHQVKLFSTYTPPRLPRLTVGGGALWQSEIYDNSPSRGGASALARKTNTQEAYTVVNLMARYVFTDHLSLTATLDNVFDKTYRTHATRHEYGAPRNLTATLRYEF